MKALIYEGAEQIRHGDVADPTAVADEILIRITAAGICGSDMHAYYGHDARRVPPLVLGHEAVGEAQNGEYAGQMVALNPLVTCGVCDYCVRGLSNLCPYRTMHGMNRQGFYAELVAVPARNVIPLPESVSPLHATLVEPLGCVVHALALGDKVSNRPLNQSRALTIGAGAIGLLTSLMLEHENCSEILTADTSGLRRDSAQHALQSTVIDPIGNTFEGDFDLVIDAVGSPKSRQTAMEAVAPGGTILHLGLHEGGAGIEARALTLKEIAVMGSYAYTHNDLINALELLNQGALGDLAWIDERPLADGSESFRALAAHEVASPKIILRTCG